VPIKIGIPEEDKIIIEPAVNQEKAVIKRDFKISRDDVTRYGLTPGCKGCLAADSRDPVARNHTVNCRNRMLKEISEHDQEKLIKITDKFLKEEDRREELKSEEVPIVNDAAELPRDIDEEMERGHVTARGSGDEAPEEDVKMQQVIYQVTADWDLSHRFNKAPQKKRYDDDVKQMNKVLAEEGFEYSIIEAYSPKRVTAMGDLLGLMPGMALDLTTLDTDGKPWDFNDEQKREKAKKMIKEKKALLLIGSPMCAAFSQLQHLNFGRMTPEDVEKVKEHGRRHLEFSLELYRLQHENGLYFLHEHPFNAASWEHEGVKELLTLPDVVKIKSHMCAFGMRDEDHAGGGLVKKSTGFMTNAIKIADILSKDCSGDHRHVVLIGGGRARRAQVYPDELCRHIILGLKDQMMHDGRLGKGLIGAVDRIDEGFKLDEKDYVNV
jgi:hypothetical protein